MNRADCEFILRGDFNDCAHAGGGRGAPLTDWCKPCLRAEVQAVRGERDELASGERYAAVRLAYAAEAQARGEAEREKTRWLEWSDGRYPDDSPGDVIHAEPDGTITLDDGITTWNPLRALEWFDHGRG